VFDTNAKELEVLEARVVERVTEFYTYLKISRDYRRILSHITVPRQMEKQWRMSVRNIVYMLFLMLESARNSVESLVEFTPKWALYTTEILLSEIIFLDFFWRDARKKPLRAQNTTHY